MTVTPSQLYADTAEYKAEVDQRVTAALDADGYTRPDDDGLPEPDNRLVRIAIAKALGNHQVASKKQRYEDALRKLELVSTTFPSTPGPSLFNEDDDEDAKLYAAAVWGKLVSLVDRQLKTVAMETLIEEMYGKTICRVTLHPDDEPTEYVYITDDIGCILQDYSGPRNAQIRRAQEAMVKAMRPVIKRHPEHGKRLISEFRKVNEKVLDNSVQAMQLTLTEASPNGSEADDNGQ